MEQAAGLDRGREKDTEQTESEAAKPVRRVGDKTATVWLPLTDFRVCGEKAGKGRLRFGRRPVAYTDFCVHLKNGFIRGGFAWGNQMECDNMGRPAARQCFECLCKGKGRGSVCILEHEEKC